MEVKLHGLFIAFVLFVTINAREAKSRPDAVEETYGDLAGPEDDVQNDDYGDYEDGEEDGEVVVDENDDTIKNYEVGAEFRTKPEIYISNIGDTVYMPCEVTNPDAFVIVWKKDERQLLYQGDTPLQEFKNLKKYPNGTLEVHITSAADFGRYSCEILISQTNSPEIVHSIVPPTAPTILEINTADNKTEYRAGDTVQLTCVASGYPKPNITWHKGAERIGTHGESITISNLNSKMNGDGYYRCFADNNIGDPAHKVIQINVEDQPHLTIEKYIVNSDKEKDAELKCTVTAYPTAVVIWKKNGVNIVEDKPKITLKKHKSNVENILMISNLTEADFGAYTCSAKNSLGKAEETVLLVKTPALQGFIKPEKSDRDVVLTWKVESKSPISKHELHYRKKGDTNWQKLHPEVINSENDVYTLKYLLKGLEPGKYEAKVRSQNVHGWSQFSEVTSFEGVLAKNGSHHKQHNKKHHKEKSMRDEQDTSSTSPRPHQEKGHIESLGASEVGGCTTVVSSAYLISIALLTLFYNRQ